MLTRILLGVLVAVAVILVLAAVIAAMAPYIAIGVVLWIGWKCLGYSGPDNDLETTSIITVEPNREP